MLVKTKIAGLVMAIMALSAPMVWADNGTVPDSSHKDGNWHQGHEHMMAKILNLSDNQEKQLKESQEKQKTEMKSVFEQMKSNREAFEAEISKATPDMSKITDLQTQLKTIQSQMVDSHLNSLLEIKKILTPEQFAGYMALEKAKKLMMMHKGRHYDDHGMEGHKNWGDKDGQGSKDHDGQD